MIHISYTVKLGVTQKKFNSTAQPSVDGWDTFEVNLKTPTDLDAPIVTLVTSGGFPNYNYGWIPSMSAFYWVSGIRAVRANVYEISLYMDSLATYKSQILGTRCYIEYGFNVDSSGAQYRLQDTRQNISQVPQITTTEVDITGGLIDLISGTYVLTAVGKSGGVAAYAISGANMRKILDKVATDIGDAIETKESVEEILSYLTLNSVMQGSAIQTIRNCVWLPISISNMGAISTSTNVYLGDFDTGVTAARLGDRPTLTRQTSLAIPWPVEDWKRLNTQILMYLPFVGTVSVPVDQCNNADTLYFTFCLDCIGGDISIRMDAGTYTVYVGSSNCAVPYAIGSSNVPIQNKVMGMMQSVTGAVQVGGGAAGLASVGAQALTGGALGGEAVQQGVSNIAAGIQNITSGTLQIITPVVQCAGTLGGSAAAGQSMFARIELLYYPPLDDTSFQAVYGYPVMRIGTPVAGYCKTRGFSIAIPGRASEAGQINALMDSGVFIE